MATVEIADPDENGTIRQVANAGVNGGRPIEPATRPADGSSGVGPTEIAIKSDATKVERNSEGKPAMDLWSTAAIRHSDRSIVSLPLRVSDRIFGAFTLYASQPDAFTSTAEVSLLKDFANNIAYGVAALRARAAASNN